ncbi:MAG: transcriptional regulator with XRE-family HTH domain [Planctomycetota bacterium]|jgi:transcriptional regulator with XRE-family HTH domain
MKIDQLTPSAAVLDELGKRLTCIRKQQGYSQEALAQLAGIGVATLRRVEDGNDGKLGSWIRILKALRLESSIDTLLPENFRSPMAEVKAGRKSSKRGKRGNGGGTGFTWGDERP